MSERGCTCTTLRHARGCPLERQNRLDYSQPAMTTPTTAAGRAQHDLAWDTAHEPSVGSHTWDREGCEACAVIARIEAEAAAQALADAVERVAMHLHEHCRAEIARREAIRPGGLYTQHMPDAHDPDARRILGIAAAPASPEGGE